MSADHDSTFVRTFLAIIGALVAFTFVIIVIARLLAPAAAPSGLVPAQKKRVEANTQPVFQVITNPNAVKVAMQSSGGGAKKSGKPMSGQEVFQQVCSACHQTGVMGAPKVTSKSDWAKRLAKGKATLYKHAIHGFNKMPAKGGHPSLSDQEIHNAVDFMAKKSGAAP